VLGARAVVEVGTGTGVSGLWLLRGMRQDGVLTTIDTEAEHQRLAKQTFTEGGIAAQTRQVLNNLQAVLAAAGSSFERAVKATGFLKNMGDFGAMNEVYSEFLGASKPARSTVAVADLPRGALVEIDLIATT